MAVRNGGLILQFLIPGGETAEPSRKGKPQAVLNRAAPAGAQPQSPGHRVAAVTLVIAAASFFVASCIPGGETSDPQVAFWRSLRALCGQAFEGRMVQGSAADSAALSGPLVLDVWQCYSGELRLAFHAGEDHSRVWLLTPTDSGLALHHAVHDRNGEEGTFSGYGGETTSPGTASVQVFRPDDQTLADVPTAAGTEWVLEIVPRERITYTLRSPATTDFQVTFDLSRRAGRPPAPWGFTRE